MKIVYVIDSLASRGGAERILSQKMSYLAEQYNYDVYVITCYQDQEATPNAYYLSERVKQINLNIPYYSQYKYKYPQRLWVKYSMHRNLLKGLRSKVIQIDPDILIGLGYFMADIVSSIKCRAAKIIESHEARIFTMSDFGLYRSWISKTYMNFYRKRYFRTVEKNTDVVVTLTLGDAQEWRKAKRVEVIPNFTMMRPSSVSYNIDCKRIISVGRLEWQKGYDRLIEIWQIVTKKHPQWELVIFGDGTLEQELKSQIKTAGLTNMSIHPFTKDISQEYSNSSIFVLSSRFEGFSLVLLEAMQHGLPCVAFDCPFGPKDVINDNVCGYIIKDHDKEEFADKICSLIEDSPKRVQFSKAAIQRAAFFGVDNVMAKWISLFDSLSYNEYMQR